MSTHPGLFGEKEEACELVCYPLCTRCGGGGADPQEGWSQAGLGFAA